MPVVKTIQQTVRGTRSPGMMVPGRSSVMQDIAIAIGERIHELIILEIQRMCREVMEQQDQITRRLTVLENSFPVRKEIPVNFNQSYQSRMKGTNIIAIRKRLQLSQAVFARLLNVDRANLCKWEHDKVVPTPATAVKIAAYRNMGKKTLRKKLQELEEKMWDN